MTLTLSSIQDQEFAVDTLKKAIASAKVHHAYLFEGPAGVGKELTALALALALNCTESDEGCLSCTNCRKILSGNHPDVRTLTLPEGKRLIPIDAVREADRWVSLSPHEGRAKVLIIAPADAMTEPAANAILKTLEEPRAGSYLLLVTAMASSLLPTVRSRCQKVRFKSLSDATVVQILEGQGVSSEEAILAASLASGSMDRAEQYVGDEFPSRVDAVMGLLEGASSRTPEKALAVAESLRADKDEVFATLELFLLVLEELMWLRSCGGDAASSSPLASRLGERFAALAATGSPGSTAGHIAAVNKAMTGMKRNNMNSQLALEGMLMSMRRRADASWSRIGAK